MEETGLSACAVPEPARMRVGIGSYAFRWAVELQGLAPADLLRHAAALGAEVVQLCDNLPVVGLSRAELQALAALAQDLEITLELGIKGLDLEHLRQSLQAAEALGVRVLRTVPAGSGREPSPAEAVAAIRALLPELHARGICLALENHFDLTISELAGVVATIDDRLVGVCLDPFNSVCRLNSQQEVAHLLAPYTVTAHVKDVQAARQGTGFSIRGCPLGEGLLDLPGLLAALRAAGRSPALLLEAWMDRLEEDAATCAQEEQWVRTGLQYLHRVVKEN